LVVDVEEMKWRGGFKTLAQLPGKEEPSGEYKRIYISKIRKGDYYWVGGPANKSLVKGDNLKIALRTLGPRNLRDYLTGENHFWDYTLERSR